MTFNPPGVQEQVWHMVKYCAAEATAAFNEMELNYFSGTGAEMVEEFDKTISFACGATMATKERRLERLKSLQRKLSECGKEVPVQELCSWA